MKKTESILGESIDLGIFSDDEEYDEPNLRQSTRNQAIASRKRKSSFGSGREQKEYLLSEANSFRDFENFAIALDALEHWKAVADEYAK